MKVPALRRGNGYTGRGGKYEPAGLNESPRPKAGKFGEPGAGLPEHKCLNESPRPKAGKSSVASYPFSERKPQ